MFATPAGAVLFFFAACLPQVVVLDTIPLSAECANNPKIIQLSVAHLLAQAVYNIHHKKSISALFK